MVDPAEYRTEPGEPGRLIAIYPFGLPLPERMAGGIEIEFTAGFGDSAADVPTALREAILQLTATSYAGAEPAQTASRGDGALPEGIHALISPWRRYAL